MAESRPKEEERKGNGSDSESEESEEKNGEKKICYLLCLISEKELSFVDRVFLYSFLTENGEFVQFYDPNADDCDEEWIRKRQKGAGTILSCCGCFTTICLDAQPLSIIL